jgi:hypothetical protein
MPPTCSYHLPWPPDSGIPPFRPIRNDAVESPELRGWSYNEADRKIRLVATHGVSDQGLCSHLYVYAAR